MTGRRFRRIGATLIAMAGLTVIAALATGEVALVTTHGISMEPRFHTGDLAIIVPSSQYQVGEIVGYHSPLLHIVVLHRIVAEHGELFTFKGDNNSFLDPVRLPASAIEGRLWLHIARGGIVLGWFRSPVVLGLLAFLVIALGIGGVSRRRRARGSGPEPGVRPGRQRAPIGTVGVQWWPVGIALALVGLFGFVTAVSWTHPTTRPSQSPLAYDQNVTFSYAGLAPTGITYPKGTVTTGDPIFLQLVDTLKVGVHYALAPRSAGAVSTTALAVRGTIGATATVEGPGGWTDRLASVPPVKFSGPTVETAVPLNFTQIPALEKAFLAETGVPLVDPEIVVTPVVHIRGTMAGAALRTTDAPSLAFRVDAQSLDVLGTSAGGGDAGSPPMSVAQSGSVERSIRVSTHLVVLGRTVGVTGARRLGIGGLTLSIVGTIGTWFWWSRRRRMDENDRIRAAYGHDLVAVSASPTPRAPLVVDLETFDELARLARRYDCVILEYSHAGGHAYYVESGTTIYRCGIEPEEDVDAFGEPLSSTNTTTTGPLVASVSAYGPEAGAGAGSAVVHGPATTTKRRMRSSKPQLDDESTKVADEVHLLTCLAKAECVSGVGDPAAHLRQAVVMAREAQLDQQVIDPLVVTVRSSFDEEQPGDPQRIAQLESSSASCDGSSASRARLLGALAVELIFVGDPSHRQRVLDEAWELALDSGDPQALIEASSCNFLSRPRSTWTSAQFAHDHAEFGRALDHAEALGDPFWLATMQAQSALFAFIDGDGDEIRRATTALSDTSADGQNQITLRAQLLMEQAIGVIEGRLAEAETVASEASAVRRTTGLDETDKAGAMGQIALRREQCRLPELIPALTDDASGRSPAAAAVGATAFALVEGGHGDTAATLLRKAGHDGFRDIPDDVHWPLAVAMWCEVAAQVGDRREAAMLYEILQPHAGRQLASNGTGCGPVARLLALLENVLGGPADADRHFAEAIEFSRRLQSPVWTARCQLEWGKICLERGETARAAKLTDAADATAGMLALPALQRQWDELIRLF